MAKRSRGFSLVELVIAVALGALVMFAVFGLMTSMVRFQIEGLKKGSAVGWSLSSLSAMNKELEGANVLVMPNSVTIDSDWVQACTNWSRILQGPIDGTQNRVQFYYCYENSVPPRLRRLSAEGNTVTCPTTASAPTCTAAWSVPGPGTKRNDVVATNVYKNAGTTIFRRDWAANGLSIRFVVGEETYTGGVAGKPDVVNPQFVKIDTRVSISRSYLDTYD